jgi:hypothetical protein
MTDILYKSLIDTIERKKFYYLEINLNECKNAQFLTSEKIIYLM